MADIHPTQPGGPTSCPYCQQTDSRVRIVRYQAGRKIETRECDGCHWTWDVPADFALGAAEARALSGERKGL